MIRPKKETKNSLLSITQNCGTVIHQTKTKPQETLEFQLNQPRETFSFTPYNFLGFDSDWMIGLTILETYNFIFNVTEENNKFELYADTFREFSFGELKLELEEILSISDTSPEDLKLIRWERLSLMHIQT